ncbi:hypothetical protein EDB19DRAFT_1716596 [Suillus lakei]|nr:hypothetical protein EDB19DRAFT_1716596 [Suillus lakei]
MPAKPAKTLVSSPTNVQHAFLPYARHTSVVGVHTSLVAFTALFLPQTSLLLLPTLADPDHPQSQFQDALTWCFEYTSRGGTSDQIKVDRYQCGRGRFSKLGRAVVFTSCVVLVFHATIVLFGAPSAR